MTGGMGLNLRCGKPESRKQQHGDTSHKGVVAAVDAMQIVAILCIHVFEHALLETVACVLLEHQFYVFLFKVHFFMY